MQVDIWRAKASDVRRSKANIQFDPIITADKAKEEIVRLVKLHSVVLFIKGTRQAPQCGFTGACVALFFFKKKGKPASPVRVLLFFFKKRENRLHRYVCCSSGV